MPERYWFIRSRGRVLGPFTVPQLEAMRARGQFTQFHEISEDRLNWESAATLTHLFPPAGGASTVRATSQEFSIDEGPAAAAGSADGWFFAIGERREGPIPFDELQRKASRGEVQPDTPVWSAGMADWAPARTIGGLSFPGAGVVSGPANSPLQAPLAPYPTRTSGMAIASLVLGILWLWCIGSVLAIIFGRIAMGEIDRSSGTIGGRGMAVAGLVLGIVGFAMPVLFVVAALIADLNGRY